MRVNHQHGFVPGRGSVNCLVVWPGGLVDIALRVEGRDFVSGAYLRQRSGDQRKENVFHWGEMRGNPKKLSGV